MLCFLLQILQKGLSWHQGSLSLCDKKSEQGFFKSEQGFFNFMMSFLV